MSDIYINVTISLGPLTSIPPKVPEWSFLSFVLVGECVLRTVYGRVGFEFGVEELIKLLRVFFTGDVMQLDTYR